MTLSLGLGCPLEVKGGAAACATRVGLSGPASRQAPSLPCSPSSLILMVPAGGGQGLCVHLCWVTMETPEHKTSLYAKLQLDPGLGRDRMRGGV